MIEFTVTQTSTAPIERVFDALTDHRAIADTTWMIRRSTLDREGTPAPNGVGAQRRLVSFGATFVEEVRSYDRPNELTYSVLSGAPVRDHLGTVTLRAVDGGTEVAWHVRAASRIPGADWLLTPASEVLIRSLLSGAIAAAEAGAAR